MAPPTGSNSAAAVADTETPPTGPDAVAEPAAFKEDTASTRPRVVAEEGETRVLDDEEEEEEDEEVVNLDRG